MERSREGTGRRVEDKSESDAGEIEAVLLKSVCLTPPHLYRNCLILEKKRHQIRSVHVCMCMRNREGERERAFPT